MSQLTDDQIDGVIAKLRAGEAYFYSAYAAGSQETLSAEGPGFRLEERTMDGDHTSTWTEAEFREWASTRTYLAEWAGGE